MGFLSPLPPLGLGANPTNPAGFIAFPFFLAGIALPEGTEDVSGAVQAQDAVVAGVLTRTAFRTISGGVQADSAAVSGVVSRATTDISGGVQAQDAGVSGALTDYPLVGWSLTNFTVNHAGLDPDSPFADPIYSAIVIGDKCHHETLTSPDSHTMTMDGLGEFSISPEFLAGPQTFDFQLYDLSDGTFGSISEITVYPGDAGSVVDGGVQAGNASAAGSLNNFLVITSSGGVQADNATVLGNVNIGGITDIFGGVQADTATISGSIERAITLSGSIQAQTAIVSGSIIRAGELLGGVQAGSATVTGSILTGGVSPTGNIGSKKVRKIKTSKVTRRHKFTQVKR